ncbi:MULTISPECIES: hypothetical protein [Gordonia]|uniref:Uncharacterized protein n=1 Tax=Gordonia amicalis TaxID=89053 RepID=A0AAE4R1Z4_9ACTN|nr:MULTISPECIES: hypothetical protein [Gordonia]ATD70031.1 hypothetical protein CNO18_06855 [Gordonia sp. 1D]KAF0969658.1 hypothetical protein BPODLACK_01942 [Gordonia sp. YY1]MCZ4578908.1 hypothetical protein [Gordonia amicalis]MDJ0455086.1 hypothetical protein [Gordonia amicalis]MDV6310149.1 hypothetical protein [Gordonia amicalis]
MTAAMLTFAGTLLVAMIGAVIARLDANDRHQKLSQKVDILAKLSPETPVHTRMSGIVLAAIDDLAEHEHRRRSAVFQRRTLTMAFLAWLVVVGFRIAAEQFDLGHYESVMHYVAVTLLVTGFVLVLASAVATVRDFRHRDEENTV